MVAWCSRPPTFNVDLLRECRPGADECSEKDERAFHIGCPDSSPSDAATIGMAAAPAERRQAQDHKRDGSIWRLARMLASRCRDEDDINRR
jgi:hypothetical protein